MGRFKRKQIQMAKKADAILCADIHLRETTPQCRVDNYWESQERKFDFILSLAKEHNNCPILCAGDLGHFPRWSCKLLEWFISKVDKTRVKIICVAGQHDVLNHRISTWHQSGIGVLHAAGAIEFIQSPEIINNKFIVYPFSYGEKMTLPEENDSNLLKICMTHQMVVENKDLFPGQNALRGHSLLKQFQGYNLILSGDNHLPFVSEYKERILCNPGSMARTTANQIEHRPRVYLWYVKTNKVEAVYLPIEQGVISREHIDIAEERSDRMDAYLERLQNDVEIELSFETNIESYLAKYRTQLSIKERVYDAIGG